VRLGSLVIKRNPWTSGSRRLGIVVEPGDGTGYWVVLWSNRHGYSLEEHLEDALLAIEDDMRLKECISE